MWDTPTNMEVIFKGLSKSLTQSHLPPPVLGGCGADPVSQAIFQEQVKEYIKHSNKLEENLKSLWRQSSDAIQS